VSAKEKGAKGVGSVVVSSDKATKLVETAKAESTASTTSGTTCTKAQHTISGTVKVSQKATDDVTISGGGKSTTSGPKGKYSLTFDAGTTVTLAYALAFHTTVTRSVGPLTADVTENVNLPRNRWTVSGQLVWGGETPKEVRVTLSGLDKEQGKLTTSEFSFPTIPEGVRITLRVHTYIPELGCTPEEIVIDSLTANLTGQNFTYARKSLKISGTTKNGEANLADVTVTVTGKEPFITKSDGKYEFTELRSGEKYVVSADHKHFSFAPRTISSLVLNEVVDFTATRKQWSIKGKVLFADDAVKKVTVKLTSTALTEAQTTTTAADGAYAFTDLPSGGKYTVSIDTSTKYNITSRPAAVDELARDETGLDFGGAWKAFALLGNIADSVGNLPKCPVTLSGDQDDAMDTNGTGDYTFTVDAGGTYDVAPGPLWPYSFDYTSRGVDAIAARTVKNFIAAWAAPPSGQEKEVGEITYGMDASPCPKCRTRTILHPACPLRNTQASYDKCKELYGIIRARNSKFGTMVGVLVCDDAGATRYIGAHSGGDDDPAGWQTKATEKGFTVALYAAPSALRTTAGNALGSTAATGNNEVGRCAAPKLIQAANANGWTPLGMTEMALNLKGYTNEKTITSCKTCQSIVAQMLCNT
jgi:hypothetical protein